MRLEVHFCDTLVGLLDDSSGRLLFQYDRYWLRGGIELSPFYLPLQEGVISLNGPFEGGLAGVFADSLPDYWGRSIMDRRLLESGINPAEVSVLKRLALVGNGGLGALSFRPAESDNDFELKSLADAVSFSREVQQFKADPLPGTAIMQQAGSNPGGRFPKLFVGWNPESEELVVGTQDYPKGFVPCLLKLELGSDSIGEERELCRREFDMLAKAERCGLRVPERWLLRSEDNRGGTLSHLLVRRFDRVAEKRLHFQSFSGIAHKLPVRYGNSYEELMRTVLTLTRDQREVDELFRRAVFNVLCGNRDDHVRNHAFLMTDANVWQLSPAYDLTPTPQLTKHCLSINGKWANIEVEDLRTLGNKFSVQGVESIIGRVREE